MANLIFSDFTSKEVEKFFTSIIDAGVSKKDTVLNIDETKAKAIVSILAGSPAGAVAQPQQNAQPQPQVVSTPAPKPAPSLKFITSSLKTVEEVMNALKPAAKGLTADAVLIDQRIKKQSQKTSNDNNYIIFWDSAVVSGDSVLIDFLVPDGANWKKQNGVFKLADKWFPNYLSAVTQ